MTTLQTLQADKKDLLAALASPGNSSVFWVLLAKVLGLHAGVDSVEMLTEDEDGNFRSVARLKFHDATWRSDFEIQKDIMQSDIARRALVASETQTGVGAAWTPKNKAYAVIPVFSRDGGIGVLCLESAKAFDKEILDQCEDLAAFSAIAVRMDGLNNRLAAVLSQETQIEGQMNAMEGRAAAGVVASDVISDVQKWIDSLVFTLHPGMPDELKNVVTAVTQDGIARFQNDKAVLRKAVPSLVTDLFTLVDEAVQYSRDRIAAKALNITIANQYLMRDLVEADPAFLEKVLRMLTEHIMHIAESGSMIQIHGRRDLSTVALLLNISAIRPNGLDKLIMQILKDDLAIHGIEFGFKISTSAEFYFSLAALQREPLANEPLKSSGAMRVMIVDDDESLRELMVDILESRNYQVVCCEDGMQAMERFRKESYDMLITDLGLPKISGSALAEQVRVIYPNMPIVMMTGWSSDVNPLDRQKLHVDYLLSKPFNLNELLETVETGLQSVKTPRAS